MIIGFPVPADAISVWSHTEDGDILVVDPAVAYPPAVYLRFFSATLHRLRGVRRSHAARLLKRVPPTSDQHHAAVATYARWRVAPSPGVQVRSIQPLLSAAMLPCFDVRIDPPPISESDVRLVSHWHDSVDIPPASRRHDSVDADDARDDFSRLMSARVAETALMKFYEASGKRVVDVSSQQLDDPVTAPGEWKRYDILADDVPIDVKNARVIHPRLWKGDPWKRYVKHCVPRFKQLRDGKEVRIAGVISSFVHPSTAKAFGSASGSDSRPMFIGEVTRDRIQRLQVSFTDSACDAFRADRPEDGPEAFLRPWVFDYPEWLYRERDMALEAARERLSAGGWDAVGGRKLAVSIAAGVPVSDRTVRELEPWVADLYHRLFSKVRLSGRPSLPCVFLTLLDHFALVVRGSVAVSSSYTPACYAELVFWRDSARSNPVALYDPLLLVHNLISSLEKLWRGLKQPLMASSFRHFELVRAGVLRARSTTSGQVLTLLAYCGECGRDPLVLGTEGWCPDCGHLVCTECGACKVDCRSRAARHAQSYVPHC